MKKKQENDDKIKQEMSVEIAIATLDKFIETLDSEEVSNKDIQDLLSQLCFLIKMTLMLISKKNKNAEFIVENINNESKRTTKLISSFYS